MSASTSSRWLALAGVLSLSGCALLKQGTSQEVAFTSEPAGAQVSVAGQTAITPTSVVLRKGDYRVEFLKEGYTLEVFELKSRISEHFFIGLLLIGPISASIDLVTGAWKEFETTTVHVVLEPMGAEADSVVALTSQPSAADILFNGISLGRTPATVKLAWSAGERRKDIVFQLPGFAEKTVTLERDAHSVHANLDLRHTATRVEFRSKPEGAHVKVQGALLEGVTPLSADVTWSPKAATTAVEILKEGYKPAKLQLVPDQNSASAELEEAVETILLPLELRPQGAKIEVDGAAVTLSADGVLLRWSLGEPRHTLTFSYPGYATKTELVTRERARGPLRIRLEPAVLRQP